MSGYMLLIETLTLWPQAQGVLAAAVRLLSLLAAEPGRAAALAGNAAATKQLAAAGQLLARRVDVEARYLARLEGTNPSQGLGLRNDAGAPRGRGGALPGAPGGCAPWPWLGSHAFISGKSGSEQDAAVLSQASRSWCGIAECDAAPRMSCRTGNAVHF